MTSLLVLAVPLVAAAADPTVTVEPRLADEAAPPGAAASAPAPAPTPPPTRWYGGPALGADVAVPTLLLLAAGSRSTGLALIGLAVYGLGAPINHLAHDNVGRGVASLALRVGSLASSYAILVETFSGRCGNDEVAHPSYCDWGVGAALALPIAAAILDDVLFARAPRADAAPARVSFVPGLAFAGGAAVMSLGGRF